MFWNKFLSNNKSAGIEVADKVCRAIILNKKDDKFLIEDCFSDNKENLDKVISKIRRLKIKQIVATTNQTEVKKDLKQKYSEIKIISSAESLKNVFIAEHTFTILIDINNPAKIVIVEGSQIKTEKVLGFSLIDLIESIAKNKEGNLTKEQIDSFLMEEGFNTNNERLSVLLLPWGLYLANQLEEFIIQASKYEKNICLVNGEKINGLKQFLQTKTKIKVLEGDILINLAYNLKSIPNISKSQLGEYRLALGAGLEGKN